MYRSLPVLGLTEAALLSALLLLPSPTAFAGIDEWSAGGPLARVTALAVEDTEEGTLYAAAADGIYRSSDHGDTWTRASTQLTSAQVSVLLANPGIPGSLIAAGCGVWRSENGGVDWTPFDTDLPPGCFLSRLAYDRARPYYLYASGAGAGLYQTTFDSSGLHWIASGREVWTGPVEVAAHPNNFRRIFAATEAGRFFRSDDKGASWAAASSAPPGGRVLELTVAVVNSKDELLTAVTEGGISISRDAGDSWSELDPLPGGRVNSLTRLRRNTAVRYVAAENGVYRQINRGANDPWLPFQAGLPEGLAIRNVLSNATGRFLVALPSESNGTFVYQYGNPQIRLTPSTATALVGRSARIQLEISPPQPEAIRATVESSDAATAVPGFESTGYLPDWASSIPFSIHALRSTETPVTIRVKVPDALGGSETSVRVTAVNPIATLQNLNPSVLSAGASSVTLWVSGTDFVEGSTINWNGSPRATRTPPSTPCPLICPQFREITVFPEDLAAPGIARITVVNPAPGGGTSNVLTLLIAPIHGRPAVDRPSEGRPGAKRKDFGAPLGNRAAVSRETRVTEDSMSLQIPNPVPVLGAISPTAAPIGTTRLVLYAFSTGRTFDAGSTVLWNGSPRPTRTNGTTLCNPGPCATWLEATLSADDFATAGKASVTVVNPGPGGGISNPLDFEITPSAARAPVRPAYPECRGRCLGSRIRPRPVAPRS